MRAMASHPNIIKLYEVFEDEKDLYLVLELCSGGELFDRIKAVGNYSEADAAKVLRQCFEGVKFMHDQKIAHVRMQYHADCIRVAFVSFTVSVCCVMCILLV